MDRLHNIREKNNYTVFCAAGRMYIQSTQPPEPQDTIVPSHATRPSETSRSQAELNFRNEGAQLNGQREFLAIKAIRVLQMSRIGFFTVLLDSLTSSWSVNRNQERALLCEGRLGRVTCRSLILTVPTRVQKEKKRWARQNCRTNSEKPIDSSTYLPTVEATATIDNG